MKNQGGKDTKKNEIITDGWKDDKKAIYELLIKNNIQRIPINIPKTTITIHEAKKDWICYICDNPIEGLYYCEFSDGKEWTRRRIWLKCTSRILGALINPYHFDRILNLR